MRHNLISTSISGTNRIKRGCDLKDIIGDILTVHAEKPFIIDAGTGAVITYRKLDQIAKNIAGFLHETGFRAGDHIGLFCSNSPEFALMYFGCLWGKFVAVPVNPALPAADIEHILTHAGLKALFRNSVENTSKVKIPDGIPVFDLGAREVRETIFPVDRDYLPDPDHQQVSSIFFTSGTTSKPKGVVHKAGSFLSAAMAFNAASWINERTRLMHVLPMAYMAGFLNTLICPFVAGASVVLCPAFNAFSAMNFWQPVFKYEINALWLVPMMLASLLKIDRNAAAAEYCRVNRCRAYVGTAPLPLWLKNDFEKRYSMSIYESYGLSETLFIAANGPQVQYSEGSAGQPLNGVKLRIEDSGELKVRASWLMKEYWSEGKNLLSDPDGWFPTGDIVRIDKNGGLFITGRCKDLIIRGGINLSPLAIEEKLMMSGLFEMVAVVGLPHKELGEEVVAAVILKTAGTRNDAENFRRTNFSSGYGPDRLAYLPELPLNSNGKILKNVLKAQFGRQG